MAAVRCERCGAVVSARRVSGDVETSYGADFREKCRDLRDRLGADFVSTVVECSHMAKFIERAAFRITQSARVSGPLPAVEATASKGTRAADI
jgi:hypothetical protein